MNKVLFCCWLLTGFFISATAHADEMGQDIQATTPSGDTVILHPNGRWEFRDTKKAAQAAEIARQYPENQVCPPGTQGGHFGIGRCVPKGDPAFNRGSIIGK